MLLGSLSHWPTVEGSLVQQNREQSGPMSRVAAKPVFHASAKQTCEHFFNHVALSGGLSLKNSPW